MGYVENNLMQGERLCVTGRVHWIIFSKAAILCSAALLLMLFSLKISAGGDARLASSVRYAGLVTLFLALWSFGSGLINRLSTELAVTSKRVIVKFGFIRRSTIELNHSKVESFHVHQGLFGRIFGYGTLHINGTGGGMTPIQNIADPLGFRRKAMEAIDASQSNY